VLPSARNIQQLAGQHSDDDPDQPSRRKAEGIDRAGWRVGHGSRRSLSVAGSVASGLSRLTRVPPECVAFILCVS